jgi:hypothetical protein
MKTQFQCRTNVFIRTAALGLSVLVGGMSPKASALPDGAAPTLVGLKIATPAGDAVEMSTNDESLSSVALEVNIEADRQGVRYFDLNFRSPDKTRVATYRGSGNSSPTKSNPLLPRDETNLTFLLGAGRLSKFYESRGFVRPLDAPGVWTLESAYLYGRNGKGTYVSASDGNLPAGLTNSFQVTRWFAKQPVFTSAVVGSTLLLAPGINSSAVASPTYQWFRNGAAISGATKLEYSKTNVTAADAGLYYLQVTSGSTKVRSDAVPVSIRSADVVAARSEINLQNAVRAKQRVAAALKVSPDGGEALFVSALSELLGVLTDPLTRPLLTDMGASVTPKFPFADFNWTGTFPATANSAKFSAWLLSVFLPAVERADTALGKITDPRFVTWVSGADFSQWSPDGTTSDGYLLVDYGDIQGLRVGLNALGAFFRLWTSMDTSVRLDSLQALQPQGKLSLEAILKEYPNLLAAAADGSANQKLSVDAMTRAATAYKKFADFVFNPSGTPGAATRYVDGDLNLFNVQRQFAEDGIIGLENEPYFGDLFSNIAASAAGGTREFIADSEDRLGVLSRYPVNLKALKERPAGVRSANPAQSFVPAFKGNLVSGVVANASLNGVLPLLNAGSLSQRIAASEPAITKALGTRGDQAAPSLVLNVHPANGSKVLVGPESGPVVFSGNVQDESALNGVFLKLSLRGETELYSAKLTEGESKQVGGRTIRSWNWSVEVPFKSSSAYGYSIYAEDQFNQRSVPKTGNFGVVMAVRVTVSSGTLAGGTVSLVPKIPQNGLVEVGTRLRLSAVATAGSLFSKFQVKIGGALEETFRATRYVLVTAPTEITSVFVPNPYPALAGQWTGLLGSNGFANLTVTKTGTFTLRVVRGRSTFSYAGVMDASGKASIPAANLSLELNNGIQLRQTDSSGQAPSVMARAATPESVKSLPHKRFNAALLGGVSAGYFTFDATSTGVVVSTGMVNLPGGSQGGTAYPQKTVRYSFSTPLVASASAPVRLGMSFYAVASPGDIGVNGSATIDGATMLGSVGFSTVPARSTVPSATTDVYLMKDVPLEGYGYKPPGSGDWVLPSSSSQMSLTAGVAARVPNGTSYQAPSTMGKLNFAVGKAPTFVYGASGANPFVTSKTTLRLTSATGAFSGVLGTQVNGLPVTRAYSGLVLRAAGSSGTGPLAVGLSSDGLLISFAP